MKVVCRADICKVNRDIFFSIYIPADKVWEEDVNFHASWHNPDPSNQGGREALSVCGLHYTCLQGQCQPLPSSRAEVG